MEKTLQAIRDRLFLLIKESELRENTIASSLSKNKSRLTVFCPKDPTKVGKLLNLCTQQVLGSSPKQHIQLQRNGSFLTLTIENTSTRQRTAEDEVKPLKVPFSAAYGENTYSINSPDSGTTFNVIRNEEVVETECPSVAFALGKLQKHILVDLSYSEELEDGASEDVQNEIDKEFMKAIAEFMANSPVVNEEAKRHLTIFVELLTNREFEPEEVEEPTI